MIRFSEEVALEKELFRPLKKKFVELGSPMQEMWKLVMPKTSHRLHRFGGKPETMAKLKMFLLRRSTEVLGENDRFWAHDALDKALNPQHAKLHMKSGPTLPYQNMRHGYVGMPSVGGASPGGLNMSGVPIADPWMLSGSNIFGEPIAGPLSPPFPQPAGVPPPFPVPWAGVEQRPLSTPPLATSIPPPSQDPGPTDEQLFREMQLYLSTQDLMTVMKR